MESRPPHVVLNIDNLNEETAETPSCYGASGNVRTDVSRSPFSSMSGPSQIQQPAIPIVSLIETSLASRSTTPRTDGGDRNSAWENQRSDRVANHARVSDLNDSVVRNVLSFLDHDEVIQSRAVCHKWRRVVMEPGQFLHVRRAYGTLAWRSRSWMIARNNFAFDFGVGSKLLFLLTVALFGLPFLGYYDGECQEEQLGTILYIALVIPIGLALSFAAVFVAIKCRRSWRSFTNPMTAVAMAIAFFAMSIPTFYYYSAYQELEALNDVQPHYAECPILDNSPYPVFVKFDMPAWWQVEAEVHEVNGIKFRWAVLSASVRQLMEFGNQSCTGGGNAWYDSAMYRAFMPNLPIDLDKPWNVTRFPIDAGLLGLNLPTRLTHTQPFEVIHSTYYAIYHSDATIDHADRRRTYHSWRRSGIYEVTKLPLLTGTGRYLTFELRAAHWWLMMTFLCVIVMMWTSHLIINGTICAFLCQKESASRGALESFKPIVPKKKSHRHNGDGRQTTLTRFYEWVTGKKWKHTKEPDLLRPRLSARRPVDIGAETLKSPTGRTVRGALGFPGTHESDDDGHLAGWTPKDSPRSSENGETAADQTADGTSVETPRTFPEFGAIDGQSPAPETPQTDSLAESGASFYSRQQSSFGWSATTASLSRSNTSFFRNESGALYPNGTPPPASMSAEEGPLVPITPGGVELSTSAKTVEGASPPRQLMTPPPSAPPALPEAPPPAMAYTLPVDLTVRPPGSEQMES